VHSSNAQTPQLLTTEIDGVWVLTINRTEHRNAFTPEIYSAMLDTLTRAVDDTDIGSIVLTGAGTAFSAGDDVAHYGQANDYHDSWTCCGCRAINCDGV